MRVGQESLRRWVNQADVDAGQRPGITSSESEEIRKLKAENRRLREDVAILKAATTFFAELDRLHEFWPHLELGSGLEEGHAEPLTQDSPTWVTGTSRPSAPRPTPPSPPSSGCTSPCDGDDPHPGEEPPHPDRLRTMAGMGLGARHCGGDCAVSASRCGDLPDSRHGRMLRSRCPLASLSTQALWDGRPVERLGRADLATWCRERASHVVAPTCAPLPLISSSSIEDKSPMPP